ncbi:MAG: hypothetical protein Q8O76_02150, partial [Chloroflexota bacterium]|nr:hypothetical protein [Chloroflexota bacterium]
PYTVEVSLPAVQLKHGYLASPHIVDITRRQSGKGPENVKAVTGGTYDVMVPEGLVVLPSVSLGVARKAVEELAAGGIEASAASEVARTGVALPKEQQGVVAGLWGKFGPDPFGMRRKNMRESGNPNLKLAELEHKDGWYNVSVRTVDDAMFRGLAKRLSESGFEVKAGPGRGPHLRGRWVVSIKVPTAPMSARDAAIEQAEHVKSVVYSEYVRTGAIMNPNLALAKDMRSRYQEDLKAGHMDAAEYWRGQSAAYFTGNPYAPSYTLIYMDKGGDGHQGSTFQRKADALGTAREASKSQRWARVYVYHGSPYESGQAEFVAAFIRGKKASEEGIIASIGG